jgi:23S rRNA (cytidine1920-2'-O)/16S rRNA (cytidine1409-2'-O)-methyltransferase
MKDRADRLLTEKGLARSRAHAQALIMAGQVCVGDQLVKKSSEEFPVDTQFRLKDGAQTKYVSRGGEKLEGALKDSRLSVKDLIALDIGISTGGFTDCLLQNGARSVIGLDVGHNQLDWKIRNDPRVKAFEGINARQIPRNLVPEPVDLVVIDVSFISLNLILPEAIKFLKPGGHILALIKPQFEVQKGQVGKGGIVKDPLLHAAVQEKIVKLCLSLGLASVNTFESVIEGTDGNKEFFVCARYSGHHERLPNNESQQ